jgi:hypothetical protein
VDIVQNKENNNIILLPKTFREECDIYLTKYNGKITYFSTLNLANYRNSSEVYFCHKTATQWEENKN